MVEVHTLMLTDCLSPLPAVLNSKTAVVMPHLFGQSFIIGIGPHLIGVHKVMQCCLAVVIEVIMVSVLFYFVG